MPTDFNGVRIPIGSDPPDVPGAMEAAVEDLLAKITAGSGATTNLEARVNSEIARLNSEITRLNGEISALKSADSAISSRLTRSKGVVFTSWNNSTTYNISTSWADKYSFTDTMPENGALLVVGEAELNDQADKAGDPQVRLVIDGSYMPVSTAGIANGVGAVTITVPLIGAKVVSKGSRTIKVQTSSTSSNVVGSIKNVSLRGLLVPAV